MDTPRVGDLVEVYWPADEIYYAGRITGHQKSTRQHRVQYLDGDVEMLRLDEELWRHSRGVTAKHLGAILRAAACEAAHNDAPPSQTCDAPSPAAALRLIARAATRWLRDEARRQSAPVGADALYVWVRICGDLCLEHVRDALPACEMDEATAAADSAWLLLGCRGRLAMKTYRWKRPLSADEWLIETHIMRDVAHRVSAAAQVVPIDNCTNTLQFAQCVVDAALHDVRLKSDVQE